MTTSQQLNQARLSLQLQINQQIPIVDKLAADVASGSTWNDISTRWDTSNVTVNNLENSLINLQVQNSGLQGDPGRLRLAEQLVVNRDQVDSMQAKLSAMQPASFSNLNAASAAAAISRDSAGAEVLSAQAGNLQDALPGTPFKQNFQLGPDRDTVSSLNNNGVQTAQTVPTVQTVQPSANKPTNAIKPTLSGTSDSQLGNDNNTSTVSTTGGNTPTTKGRITQGGNEAAVSNSDDAYQNPQNTVGTASQSVEGRVAVADEFTQTITATSNRLAGLASQTYSLSVYLMDKDEYKKFLRTDKKTLPTQQLIMQSGGAPIGQRNKYFDLDFFPENFELKCQVGTQGTNSPHNAVTMKFDVLEPQGITFLERLRQAVWEHTGEQTATINSQNYLMVIRFYGYDENGNLISNAQQNGGETTSDPNSLVEKFIPFQIANIRYKIASQAVEYNLDCVIPQMLVGYGTARGSIPFNFQLNAPDVQTLFNGNTNIARVQREFTDDQIIDDDAEIAAEADNKKLGLSGATVSQGLVEALNQHQQELGNKAEGYIPDRYIIELEDVPGFKDAKMKKQGTQDKTRAPMVDADDVNTKYNPAKQNFDAEGKSFSIGAGTQIVQLIDQVMKNSEYITSQQTIAFDEVTRKEIQNPPVKTVQWYKITQIATPIEWDKTRRDYAYEIKYRVTRYQINTPRSPYFPPAMYRGVHKVYNYWFTGENTEVLNFEIDANTNYLTPINNSGKVETVRGDARYAEKRFFQASAEESTQGGRGESTLPAAQLASRLYSPADVAKIDIEIVGDPDWITQSELFYSKTNLGAFEADGSVNVNAGESLFEIRFNKVVDYDAATGLTPVYKNNLAQSQITNELNLAEESLVFTAYEVTNYFKEGKFTQKLSGTLRNFDTAVDSPKEKAAEKNKVEDPQIQKPKGTNTKPKTVTGSPASTGAKPAVQKDSTISNSPVNSQFYGYFKDGQAAARLNDAEVSTVPPKPGSNTQSDDAGTAINSQFYGYFKDGAN